MAESSDGASADRSSAAVVAIAVLIVAALVWWYGRGLIFYFDEWDFIQTRRTGFVEPFLRPHNGHLSIVPTAIYRVLFRIAGLRHYGAYRLVLLGFHLLCGVLLFVYGRRRTAPLFAAIAAVTLLTLAAAWQDVLWPFQIGFLGSLVFGLLALLFVDRDRPFLASLSVLASLCSSGLGVPVLAGCLAETLVRRLWRRMIWWSAALVPYGIWYATRGGSQTADPSLGRLPIHVVRSAAFATRALTGLPAPGVGAVAGAAIIGAMAVLAAWRSPPARSRLVFASVAALSFWTLTGLTRGDLAEPGASRYLYPGALFLLVLLVEASRAVSPRRVMVVGAIAVAVAASSVVVNADSFRDGAKFLRENSSFVAANLGATEIARDSVAVDFQPDPGRAPQIRAGTYFASIRALGSPALDAKGLGAAPPGVRAAADATLLAASHVALAAPVGVATSCRDVDGSATPVPVFVQVANHSGAAEAVRVSLFGEVGAAQSVGTLEVGGVSALRLPAPPAGRTWRLAPGQFTLCTSAG